MRIKNTLVFLMASLMLIIFTSCGSTSYKDGTYTGKYENTEHKSLTKVEISIKDNKITDCKAEFYDSKGNLKDESYGMDMEGEQKEKAQLAAQGMSQYASMLVEVGNIEDMDAISGATASFKAFEEAVKEALSSAQ